MRLRTFPTPRMRHAGLALVWCVVATGNVGARLMVPEDGHTAAQEPVWSQIAEAFRAGDHDALAGLVDPAGVQLEMVPTANRVTALTPAQAFYYFRNLFENRRTVRFDFEKSQSTGDTRLHAVAIWRYERADGGDAQIQRLLLTLAHGAAGWRVIEVTNLRGD